MPAAGALLRVTFFFAAAFFVAFFAAFWNGISWPLLGPQLLELLLLHARIGRLALERYFATALVIGEFVLQLVDG